MTMPNPGPTGPWQPRTRRPSLTLAAVALVLLGLAALAAGLLQAAPADQHAVDGVAGAGLVLAYAAGLLLIPHRRRPPA